MLEIGTLGGGLVVRSHSDGSHQPLAAIISRSMAAAISQRRHLAAYEATVRFQLTHAGFRPCAELKRSLAAITSRCVIRCVACHPGSNRRLGDERGSSAGIQPVNGDEWEKGMRDATRD